MTRLKVTYGKRPRADVASSDLCERGTGPFTSKIARHGEDDASVVTVGSSRILVAPEHGDCGAHLETPEKPSIPLVSCGTRERHTVATGGSRPTAFATPGTLLRYGFATAAAALPAPKSRTSALASSKSAETATGLCQTFLDLGQRNGDSITCKLCGMTFATGEASEAKAHASYCSTHAEQCIVFSKADMSQSGARVGGFAHVLEVELCGVSAEAGASSASSSNRAVGRILTAGTSLAAAGSSGPSTAQVLKADVPNYAATQHGKLAPIVRVLESNLGGASSPLKPIYPSPDAQPVSVQYWLCVVHGTVAGVLVTERIREAWPLVHAASASSDTSSDSVSAGAGIPASATSETPAARTHSPAVELDRSRPCVATLGVCQVWVHPTHRRHGIAAHLLDAARAHAIYAHTVSIAEVAFAQPTRLGQAFARSYVAGTTLLAY